MDQTYYDMIAKRKSFHLFRNLGGERISPEELREIEEMFPRLTPLTDDIRVGMKIEKDAPFCRRGQEYCLLLYSEKKPNYLQNMGYIGEQLDLYLVSKNIGTLWFGIGKPDEKTFDGLDFVIMIAIAKVDSAAKFRKDMFKAKRKAPEEIWRGEEHRSIAEIARFAPSACNSQPWLVEAAQDSLRVYRCRKPGKVGIMPADKAAFFNQIDIGIFLCFLELCLAHEGTRFDRTLFVEKDENGEKNLAAEYRLERA